MSNFRKTLASIKKQAELENFDDEYRDKFGQVTPYHILFKDHGNEIAALDKEGAIEFCLDNISELNERYKEEPEYHIASDEELSNLREFMEREEVENGMDVLFVVKDALLESEGLEIKAKRLKRWR